MTSRIEKLPINVRIIPKAVSRFREAVKESKVTKRAQQQKEEKKKETEATYKILQYRNEVVKERKQAEKIAKENKIKENIIKQVIDFQSSAKSSITFENLTEVEFKTLVQTLTYRQGFRTTLSSGKYHMCINTNSLSNLRSIEYDQIEDYAVNSFEDFIKIIHKFDTVTITQLPAHMFKAVKKIKKTKAKKRLPKKLIQDELFPQNIPREDNLEYGRTGGAFFQYLNTTNIDLTKYGIFKTIEKTNYKNNCLINALAQVLTRNKLQQAKTLVVEKLFPVCKLKELANVLDLTIKLKKPDDRIRTYGEGETEVNLALYENHYFINDTTEINSYAIDNYEELKDKPIWNKIYMKVNNNYKRSSRGISSLDLIVKMNLNNLFKRIDLTTKNILKTQYYEDISKTIENLSYAKNQVKKVIKKEIIEQTSEIYYADFETTTEGKHAAYLCCVISMFGTKTFYGINCGQKLLEYLPTGSIIYFHNLGYDSCFFTKYFNIDSKGCIKTGSMYKMIKGNYKGKPLTFKDSYAMVAEPLKKFTKIFKVDTKKEIMPYELYTEDTVNLTSVPLEKALNFIKEGDKQEFLELAKPYIDGENFLHIQYAEFYCMQDCKLLMDGFEKFREWIIVAFNLDPIDFVSLPSLAYRYLTEQGCFEGCYELSGIPQIFIMKAMKGGRVMCRDNKKIHVKKVINDFDAVSLYPSAMHRMGFLKGKPKIIKPENLNMEFLNQVDGYFVELKNVKLNKTQHFPLQNELNEVTKTKNYVNTLTKNIFVDKFTLEDLVTYQQAEFEIVRGYYFDEGRNYKIQETIKYCFDERVKHKKDKNPIEVVYKLIMNSAYGKMLQKPITYDLKFTNTKDQHEKFIRYNHNYITEYTEIAKDKYLYKIKRPINTHFNMVHCGVEVLSMSKRIMNEVMCLAEDLDCKIYYQDTDSMHILDSDIEKLSTEFKAKYNRELIGESLGQFHSDFKDSAKSVESYFLGKKAYLDVLKGGVGWDQNKTAYHIRLKGVGDSCVKNPIQTYKDLYMNKTLSFDLAAGNKPSFKRNNDFTVTTNKEFIRKVSFKGTRYEY